jgi:hypothetical protein
MHKEENLMKHACRLSQIKSLLVKLDWDVRKAVEQSTKLEQPEKIMAIFEAARFSKKQQFFTDLRNHL